MLTTPTASPEEPVGLAGAGVGAGVGDALELESPHPVIEMTTPLNRHRGFLGKLASRDAFVDLPP